MDIKVLGIPKTIDNDLEVTDHSIGYPSAARHVINLMKMAVVDAAAYKKGKVVLVEIMGRNAGWLTGCVDVLPEGERPD
jgi:6-phosphofructokinase